MARPPKKPRTLDLDAEGGFSFGGMVKWSGATRSNLIHWTNIGIIRPDFADTAGPGYPRRFSPLNFAEVQIAASLNQFRLPTAVIRTAVDSFRDHHELCVAIAPSRSDPLADDTVALTDVQRQAVERAYVNVFIRRDERGIAREGKGRVSTPDQAIRAIRKNPLSPEEESNLLRSARLWHQFLWSAQEYFHGLFVQPLNNDGIERAEVHDEPIDLQDTIQYSSIVINLGPIISFTQAVTSNRL